MKIKRKIISLLCASAVCLFSAAASADSCKPTTCPTTCSASANSNCNKKFDAGCMIAKNKQVEGGSCFNNVPISSADYSSDQCSSADKNSELGTNFPITPSSPSDIVAVKSAAKGKVIYAGVTVDGGRTVIIEHTKACDDNGHGDTGKYHTIYRHLQSINVATFQEVDINTPIGIAGGSTATEAGSLCDNKEQSSLPGYDDRGCSGTKADDLHLNFQVKDGPASGSASEASSSAIMNANCNEIQNFCGGCSSDINTCISENPASHRESLDETTLTMLKNQQTAASSSASCSTGIDLSPEKCLFCGLFKDIFNAASAIAKIANDSLALPTKKLVGIGFMIWLAIFVLRNIASMGAIKIPDMLKAILFQGARVTAVMLILSGALYQVMDLTINPIMQTGLAFSRSFSETTTCPKEAEYLQGIVGYDSNKGFQKNSTGGLSIQIGTAFICSIKKLEDNVSGLMTYGKYSTCLSIKDFSVLGFVPHAGFLATGAFLYIVGVVLMILFPWYLIDCMLQLCITVALLPCAIGAFAFKMTSKYLKQLWDYFMNAMFNFVFIAIIIFIISANFKGWLDYDLTVAPTEVDPNIFINATQKGLAWCGATAFRILGICFFCFIFLSEAKSMAEHFAKAPTLGGGKGIGGMIGGTAASSAMVAGQFGYQGIKGIGSGIKNGAGEIAESLTGVQLRSMSNHAKGMFANFVGGEKIVDDNGNTKGYVRRAKFFGKQYEFKYTKDTQGNNEIWSSSVTKGSETTINDAILETKLTKNAAGEITGITTDAKNVSSKYMINDDKTINKNAYDQLMNNAENKEFAARHIISTVMADRGMQLDNQFISSQTKINDDGSWTIVQKNEDGKEQTVTAVFDENTHKMNITSEIKNGDGSSTITTSDGTNKKTETRPSGA